MTVLDTLAAILRGDAVPADAWRGVDTDAFCAAADRHGVLPLIAERWRTDADGPPEALAARVRELARGHAAFDMAREVELRASLSALEAAGVRPVLFKGAHLAYSDYPRPDLRPRLDTDVLIPADASARKAAHDALTALGYDAPPPVGGDLVMAQRAYVKRQDGRARHTIDVHWRVANPQLFARVLGHEELVRNAVALPRLGPAARGPSGAHALMLACVHRVAHHGGSDCLIWLYDIDRIARRLAIDDWSRFLALATERQVSEVCLVSLDRASARFFTPVPDLVRAAMAPQAAGVREPTARYLAPPGHGVRAALSDVRAMSSWRDRARVAAEHLLPPAEYMRATYAPDSRAPLAWLYVKRVMTALIGRS
jgi:hypothetical protein